MYDYGFRDYKPVLARWTTVDPVRDGTNWYAYVNNDPVNKIDLWGLEWIQTGGFGEEYDDIPDRDPYTHHGEDWVYEEDGENETEGKEIPSVEAGEVAEAGYAEDKGNYVRVTTEDGSTIDYYHLDKVSVEPGDEIEVGDTVGEGGNTGLSTAPHVHIDKWYDDAPPEIAPTVDKYGREYVNPPNLDDAQVVADKNK